MNLFLQSLIIFYILNINAFGKDPYQEFRKLTSFVACVSTNSDAPYIYTASHHDGHVQPLESVMDRASRLKLKDPLLANSFVQVFLNGLPTGHVLSGRSIWFQESSSSKTGLSHPSLLKKLGKETLQKSLIDSALQSFREREHEREKITGNFDTLESVAHKLSNGDTAGPSFEDFERALTMLRTDESKRGDDLSESIVKRIDDLLAPKSETDGASKINTVEGARILAHSALNVSFQLLSQAGLDIDPKLSRGLPLLADMVYWIKMSGVDETITRNVLTLNIIAIAFDLASIALESGPSFETQVLDSLESIQTRLRNIENLMQTHINEARVSHFRIMSSLKSVSLQIADIQTSVAKISEKIDRLSFLQETRQIWNASAIGRTEGDSAVNYLPIALGNVASIATESSGRRISINNQTVSSLAGVAMYFLSGFHPEIDDSVDASISERLFSFEDSLAINSYLNQYPTTQATPLETTTGLLQTSFLKLDSSDPNANPSWARFWGQVDRFHAHASEAGLDHVIQLAECAQNPLTCTHSSNFSIHSNISQVSTDTNEVTESIRISDSTLKQILAKMIHPVWFMAAQPGGVKLGIEFSQLFAVPLGFYPISKSIPDTSGTLKVKKSFGIGGKFNVFATTESGEKIKILENVPLFSNEAPDNMEITDTFEYNLDETFAERPALNSQSSNSYLKTRLGDVFSHFQALKAFTQTQNLQSHGGNPSTRFEKLGLGFLTPLNQSMRWSVRSSPDLYGFGTAQTVFYHCASIGACSSPGEVPKAATIQKEFQKILSLVSTNRKISIQKIMEHSINETFTHDLSLSSLAKYLEKIARRSTPARNNLGLYYSDIYRGLRKMLLNDSYRFASPVLRETFVQIIPRFKDMINIMKNMSMHGIKISVRNLELQLKYLIFKDLLKSAPPTQRLSELEKGLISPELIRIGSEQSDSETVYSSLLNQSKRNVAWMERHPKMQALSSSRSLSKISSPVQGFTARNSARRSHLNSCGQLFAL